MAAHPKMFSLRQQLSTPERTSHTPRPSRYSRRRHVPDALRGCHAGTEGACLYLRAHAAAGATEQEAVAQGQ
jgi:hypothetical protein